MAFAKVNAFSHIDRYSRVTAANRHEYVRLALSLRMREFDRAAAAVREGMARVVPVPLLSLFTGYELEAMVCGSPEIPLHLLKSVATYKGKRSRSKLYIVTRVGKLVDFELSS